MKKFEFRLQKVLDVKEILVKKTQRDLSLTEEEKSEVEKSLLKTQEYLSDFSGHLDETRREKVANLKIQYDHFYQILGEIDQQRNNLKQIQEKIEEIRKRLLLHQRNRKVLSVLKEKYFEDYLKQMESEEQKFIDESTILNHR
ncbi:MAG: flagellar export protein FliJ [Calditrichia bacterium]